MKKNSTSRLMKGIGITMAVGGVTAAIGGTMMDRRCCGKTASKAVKSMSNMLDSIQTMMK